MSILNTPLVSPPTYIPASYDQVFFKYILFSRASRLGLYAAWYGKKKITNYFLVFPVFNLIWCTRSEVKKDQEGQKYPRTEKGTINSGNVKVRKDIVGTVQCHLWDSSVSRVGQFSIWCGTVPYHVWESSVLVWELYVSIGTVQYWVRDSAVLRVGQFSIGCGTVQYRVWDSLVLGVGQLSNVCGKV